MGGKHAPIELNEYLSIHGTVMCRLEKRGYVLPGGDGGQVTPASGARAVYSALRRLQRTRREPGFHCISVGLRSNLDDEDMTTLRDGARDLGASVTVDGRWVHLDYEVEAPSWDDMYPDPPEQDYLA